MHTHYTTLSLLTLLASTLALPHEEISGGVQAARLTKRVVVTVTLTHTVEEGATPTPSKDPGFRCPDPVRACIINGAPMWPSETDGIGVGGNATMGVSSTTMVSSVTRFSSAVPITSPGAPSASPSSSSAAPPANSSLASTSTTCAHSMSHIVPGPGTGTPVPSAKKDNDSRSEKEGFHFLPVDFPPSAASGNTYSEDRLVHNSDSDSDAPLPVHVRRTPPLWHRFFAAASPLSPAQSTRDEDMDSDSDDELYVKAGEACTRCEKGRDLVCIGTTQFGYCDEGCVEPRRLGEGMRCEDGKIFGVKGKGMGMGLEGGRMDGEMERRGIERVEGM